MSGRIYSFDAGFRRFPSSRRVTPLLSIKIRGRQLSGAFFSAVIQIVSDLDIVFTNDIDDPIIICMRQTVGLNPDNIRHTDQICIGKHIGRNETNFWQKRFHHFQPAFMTTKADRAFFDFLGKGYFFLYLFIRRRLMLLVENDFSEIDQFSSQ